MKGKKKGVPSAAFTVAELLVALAIVIVCLALVGGAIHQARLSGLSAKNVKNHQAIGTALLAYAYDHKGVLPYCYETTPSTFSQRSAFPQLLTYLGYISDPRVFFGPHAGAWYPVKVLMQPQIGAVIPWHFTNYGANRYGAMPYRGQDGNRKPANLHRIAADGNLSRLILIRDTYRAGYDTPELPRGGGIPYFSARQYIPPVRKSFNGRMHATFADGHVEVFSRETMLTLSDNVSQAPLFEEVYTRPSR